MATYSHRPCRRRPLALEALESRMLLTGTWTPLANPAPDVITTMLLLSDGTVMAHASIESHLTGDWYKLTPDSSGSYVNGTWSQQASMQYQRIYYPSHVLPDGRVFVAGGEYGNGQKTGEVYDPLADAWTPTPNGILGDIGDVPSALLPDGRIIVGYRFGPATTIYDPATNSWSNAATKDDRSSEETWMLLPDQTVLNVEVWKANKAEKYIPSEDRWVSAGTLPVNLIQGSEIGAGLLLPDGRAFYIGASGKTALYSPPADYHDAGTWAAGADLPDNHGAWDAPAAMLPDGKVLLAVGPHSYNGPTDFYEYDPTANAYTKVAGSPAFSGAPWETRMLMVPTGQVLWANGSTGLYVYTPDGGPDPAWQPVISDIQDNGDGSFVLTGTQLNGISEGAAYGDDAEMSSNYPIVQLTDANGSVSYARTFNWSSTGVATGDTPVSTQFTLPNGIAPGDYSLAVIANGIASGPVPFTVAGPTRPASLAHRVSLAPFAVVATTGTAIGSSGPTRKQVDGATATEAAFRARTAETGGPWAPPAARPVESGDTGTSPEVRRDAFFATDALADSLAVLLE